LLTTGRLARQHLENRYNSRAGKFESTDFNSEIYGCAEVKELLIDLQLYKYCICESKIGQVSYGNVEHFRPKAGWIQDNEKINKPGYYWLAYEWNNLLLSCQICNQKNKNFFPVFQGSKRALSHLDDVSGEQLYL
jgi:hypothetical protein